MDPAGVVQTVGDRIGGKYQSFNSGQALLAGPLSTVWFGTLGADESIFFAATLEQVHRLLRTVEDGRLIAADTSARSNQAELWSRQASWRQAAPDLRSTGLAPSCSAAW